MLWEKGWVSCLAIGMSSDMDLLDILAEGLELVHLAGRC